jgi:citrate synthase
VADLQQTMGASDATSITVRGHDLCEDLLGRVDFASMVYLEIQGRLPEPAHATVLDAILVTLAEHGLTPNALVTRLTLAGAPESLQGAVAAGLLGVGDTFLGAMEECARLLLTLEDPIEQSAAQVVADVRADGRRIAGLGHPIHTPVDPRTIKLFALAESLDIDDRNRRRVLALQAAAETAAGRPLLVNVDGACAALLNDIGIPWQTQRGIALVARAAGLVGHAWDDMRAPIGAGVWKLAEREVGYRDPA